MHIELFNQSLICGSILQHNFVLWKWAFGLGLKLHCIDVIHHCLSFSHYTVPYSYPQGRPI